MEEIYTVNIFTYTRVVKMKTAPDMNAISLTGNVHRLGNNDSGFEYLLSSLLICELFLKLVYFPKYL